MTKILTLILASSAVMLAQAQARIPVCQEDFIDAAESTVNGVVSIKSFATPRQSQYQNYSQGFGDPLLEYFFGLTPRQQQPQQPQEPRQTGLGSGVILSNEGYIVTNNHVIEKADRLEVTLNDNRNFEATVIGTDPVTDLALIKIAADTTLHVIPMGNSEDLRVGQWVLAVGNPFGFTSTVTAGIVSAKARNISTTTGNPGSRGIESYIQTDAAVNRGNSGGALVNLAGQLVGINAAIYSQTGTYAGCSFAIPTSIVQKVVADLRQYGQVQRAYLGVSFIELTPELVKDKDIKGTVSGVMVMNVEEGTAAFEGGIEKGDIIVAIASYPVRGTAELQEAMVRFSPGDTAVITLWRDGKQITRTVTMRNRDGKTALLAAPLNPDAIPGVELMPTPDDILERLELRAAVSVRSVADDSPMARAGIRPGVIILSVNGTRVYTPDQVEEIYRTAMAESERNRVLFITGALPSGKIVHYAVTL